MTDKIPMQADGGGKPASTPEGHDPAGAGESGGGAYKETDVTTGDNTIAKRPVKTGQKPADE